MELLGNQACVIISDLRPELDEQDVYLPLIRAADKLDAYEASGLTPEEVQALAVAKEEGRMIWELPEDGWIPVTERLPERPAEYIVMIKGGAIATTLLFDGKMWFEEDAEERRTYYAVTQWAPLPDPPKEEKP